MIKPGKYINKNGLGDVAYEIVQVMQTKSGNYKIKYYCWNRGQGSSNGVRGPGWLIDNKPFKAKILNKDVANWVCINKLRSPK